jgi:hypothetical protein
MQRSPPEGRWPARSTCCAMAWSVAGCSSRYLASEASAGSSRASTCSPTTSAQQRGRRASASRPATSSSSAPDTRTVSSSLRSGKRASARPACARARPDSSQADASPRLGPMETTTRPRAPPKGLRTRSTSSRSTPWDPPARLHAVRGSRPVVRGGRAVGVPRRRLTAANRGRHRSAGQPDRDPLTRVHLQRRSSRRGPRGGRKDRLTRPDGRARRSCLAGRDPVAEPSAGVGRLTRGACPQTLRRLAGAVGPDRGGDPLADVVGAVGRGDECHQSPQPPPSARRCRATHDLSPPQRAPPTWPDSHQPPRAGPRPRPRVGPS